MRCHANSLEDIKACSIFGGCLLQAAVQGVGNEGLLCQKGVVHIVSTFFLLPEIGCLAFHVVAACDLANTTETYQPRTPIQ